MLNWDDDVDHKEKDWRQSKDNEDGKEDDEIQNILKFLKAPVFFPSLQHEVSSSIELELRALIAFLASGWVNVVVSKIEIEGINLLLEHRTKNIVSLEKDNQCSEIHRLVNDRLWLILWSGHNHETDGVHGEQFNSHSNEVKVHCKSALLRMHHCTSNLHLHVDYNLIQIFYSDQDNDTDEAQSENQIIKRSQNELSLTFKQIGEDLADGQGCGKQT